MRAPCFAFLTGATDNKIVFKNVFRNRCASANIAVAFNGNGRDNVAVTTDKTVIPDECFMFFSTVVIDKDCAATDIAVFAKLAIAYVGEMRNFAVFANDGVFYFYKIAYFCA